MINYITYIKDQLGNNFLGIKISTDTIKPHLDDLKDIIGEDKFIEYTGYKKKYNNDYYLTVIDVMEYNELSSKSGFINSLDNLFNYEIDDLKMMGVGLAERNSNKAYFVVCKSDKLEAVRNRYDLSEKDFHITIGFKYKNVFGVRKNQVLDKKDKFKQILAQSFFDKENWNFVKKIRNFNLNENEEIIPISISETIIKLRVNNYYIDVGYLDESEEFWIMAKYPVKDKLPRLPQSMIAKILSKSLS